MIKAVVLAIVVYVLADPVSDRILEPFGLGYLHAFFAMFSGMAVGGYLAPRNFVGIALLINLTFSALTYVLVASRREQPVFDLVAEQHLMVSVGSFAGAALGAWVGGLLKRTIGEKPSNEQPL